VTTETPVPIESPVVNPVANNLTENPQLDGQNQLNSAGQTKEDASLNNNAMSIAEAVQKAMNSTIPLESSNDGLPIKEVNGDNVVPPISNPAENMVVKQENTSQPTLYNELIDSNEDDLNSFRRVDNTFPSLRQEDIPSKIEQGNSNTILPMQPEIAPVMPVNNPVDFGAKAITNIPDSDILEANSANTMNSNMVSSSTVSNNNFIEVIRLIRNCASEIEKLGYKIDVDEIDLGNIYQANFKINKDN